MSVSTPAAAGSPPSTRSFIPSPRGVALAWRHGDDSDSKIFQLDRSTLELQVQDAILADGRRGKDERRDFK